MKPTEQQIEDCRVRGIVPGAVIQDASGLGRGTVSPYREWSLVEGALGRYISCGRDDTGFVLFAKHANNHFASVITSAPSPTTLTPGMACVIPSAAGRQWVKELAEAKGLWAVGSYEPSNATGIWIHNGDGHRDFGKLYSSRVESDPAEFVPIHEFIRMLMEYEPPAPPKTTEELLDEAVRILKLLSFAADAPDTDMEEARAFLKSIKP
jgi:hypothetical protein